MPTDDDSPPLSREEARLLAEQLEVLATAGLPLSSGLHAAAEEMPSPRLAAAMNGVAERLERGRSLDDVLRGSSRLMPEHMLRLIETGIRSGNLAAVLSQLVEIDRWSFDLRRSVRRVIAYPILLGVLCAMLLGLLAIFVVPDLQAIAKDFQTTLPFSTTVLFWLSGEKVWLILTATFAATTMLLFTMRVSLPPQRWRWMLTRVPLFGPMLLWRGIGSWARLAALLLKQGLPAPEALRLAGMGVDDALMAVEGLRLARAANQGRSIADALRITGTLPESILPLVRWGEEQGTLPQAFETVAEMAENRLRLRVTLLRTVLPPILFICIAIMVLWLFNAMFGPLVDLITVLSGGSTRRRGLTGPVSVKIDFSFIATIILMGIVVLAAIAIWVRAIFSIVHGPRTRSPAATRAISVLKTFLWVLFFLALFVGLMALTRVEIGLLLWCAAVVVALMIRNQRKQSAQRSLMWILGTAVAKGIPLSAAARGFGDERSDRLGAKARRLALQLDRGASLDEAMYNSHISIPTDALVALRTGYVTRSAMPLIRSAGHYAGIDAIVHSATSKIVYAMVLMLIATLIVTFLMIKIIPSYSKIFADFGRDLPVTTRYLIEFANNIYHASGVFIMLLFALAAATVYAVFRYIGVGKWDPPLVRMVTRPLDSSIILRSLAETVERRAPISSMVDALAQKYPKGHIRMRLYKAAASIANGADWCESLHNSGIFSKAEAGLLKAAERVGNLSWAMTDMADRLSRKFVARVNHILAIGFPFILFLFAAVVFFVSCAMIEPLADLVMSLSSGTRHK